MSVTDEDPQHEGPAEGDLAGKWYADRFRIGQNAFEFKVDCGHEREGDMRPEYLRVIANPSNARELFRQLGVGLLRYADRYGRDGGSGADEEAS